MSDKQKLPPDLTDVLENLKLEIFREINSVQIGTIQSFDITDQTATISLNIKKILSVNDDGTNELGNRPVLLKCPCVILGGGSSHMTFHVKSGDSCIVFFNDRDIDNWFFEGGENAPNSIRTHDLSDAIALVGIRNMQNRILDFFENGIRIKFDETNKIEMSEALTRSIVALWHHIGNVIIQGGVAVGGVITAYTGDGYPDKLVIDTDVECLHDLETVGELRAGNGWTGQFATGDSRTVTVEHGIITDVS